MSGGTQETPWGNPRRFLLLAPTNTFVTYSADIWQILKHIGVDAEPPRIIPERGPPLWDGADAQAGEVA